MVQAKQGVCKQELGKTARERLVLFRVEGRLREFNLGLIQSWGQIQIRSKKDRSPKLTTQAVVEGIKGDVRTLQAIRSLVLAAGEMAQHLKSIYCPCRRRVVFLALMAGISLSSVTPGPGILLLPSLGIRHAHQNTHTCNQNTHTRKKQNKCFSIFFQDMNVREKTEWGTLASAGKKVHPPVG